MKPTRFRSSALTLPSGLLVAVALMASACGGNASSGTSSPEPSEALDWGECDNPLHASIECAELEVPLDWSEPDGEQIELVVGRRAATGDAIGPLLSNPGGPGGSGLEYLALAAFTPELTERFDLVSWDPRGVGESTPVECDSMLPELWAADSSPDDPAERAALEDAAAAVAADCELAAGEYLEHLHTANVARDLEAIRLALGGEQLNYIGFSYGTHIGQLYADMFGPNLRAMVLDGVVDPSLAFEDFLVGQAAAFEDTFARQAAQCAAAGEQACGVPDLLAAYDEVSGMVEDSVQQSSAGPVGPSELATAAAAVGYRAGGWEAIGAALEDALRGDHSGIRMLADGYRSLVVYGPYAGVVCTDSQRPEGFEEFRAFEARAAAASPRFGAAIANEMAPCAVWGAAPQGTAEAIAAPDAPAILVVGNTGDPATPLENAEAVADSLDGGRLLVVDSDGHVAFGRDACATDAIERYLVDLHLPGTGATC